MLHSFKIKIRLTYLLVTSSKSTDIINSFNLVLICFSVSSRSVGLEQNKHKLKLEKSYLQSMKLHCFYAVINLFATYSLQKIMHKSDKCFL